MKSVEGWSAVPPNAGVVVRDAPGYPGNIREVAAEACGEGASGTVVAMAAVLSELLYETMNEDIVALVMMRAEDIALQSGVERAEWDRVSKPFWGTGV